MVNSFNVFLASALVKVSDASPQRMEDIGYLLAGYNLMRGNPTPTTGIPVDPGYTSAIFNADYSGGETTADGRYLVPKGATVKKTLGCTMTFSSHSMSGAKSYQDSLEVKASVSGGGWGAKFSASTDYKKVQTGTSSEHSLYTKAEATCSVYAADLAVIGGQGPQLKDSFLAALGVLPQEYKESAYMEFIHTYGTHYVTSMIMGSMFGQQSRFTASAWRKMELSGLNINAAASYAGFGATASANFATDSQKKQAQEFSSNAAETSQYTIGAVPPNNDDPYTWMSQVKNNPVPIRVRLDEIDHLLDDINYGKVVAQYLGSETKKATLQANMAKGLAAYCQHLLSLNQVKSCAPPGPDSPFPTAPPLIVLPASSYTRSYVDHGTGAHTDLGMWKPDLQGDEYYLGDACMPSYGYPQFHSIVVKLGSDKSALADPIGMGFDWNDRGTGGDHDGGFFHPICPSGYVGIGSVGEQFFSDVNTNPSPAYWPKLKCVNTKYVKQASFNQLTWADHGSGGTHDGSIFAGKEDTFDGQQLVGPCVGTSGYPSSRLWYVLNPRAVNSVGLSANITEDILKKKIDDVLV